MNESGAFSNPDSPLTCATEAPFSSYTVNRVSRPPSRLLSLLPRLVGESMGQREGVRTTAAIGAITERANAVVLVPPVEVDPDSDFVQSNAQLLNIRLWMHCASSPHS